jgi:endonuclease/exonuclease/phosphatase family metal-dependent hydrolase
VATVLWGGWGEGRPYLEVRAPALVPLCGEAASPEAAPDKVHIHCAIETGSFAKEDTGSTPAAGSADSLLVMTWNLERGLELPGQLDAFRRGSLPRPDLLLVSEADRGCSRSGGRQVVRELARELGLSYAFGVEFVELPRREGAGGTIEATCEHGNGILSRRPLQNVRLLRFAANRSWYRPPGERDGEEPRLGGRMALAAEVPRAGGALGVYSFHLESGIGDRAYRLAQARELAEDGRARPFPVVLGGDANVHAYALDLLLGTSLNGAVPLLLGRGFADAHAALPGQRRVTWPPLLVLDLIFVRGVAVTRPAVCPTEVCGGLSDHLPLWARITL